MSQNNLNLSMCQPEGGKKEFISTRKSIWILVSAIIFIVIVAIYEILRIAVNNYFFLKSTEDPKCHYKKHKREQKLSRNYNNLISACVFGVLVTLSAAIILPILFTWSKRYY